MHYARLASRSAMVVATWAAVSTACSSDDDSSGAQLGSSGAPAAGNHTGGLSAAGDTAGAMSGPAGEAASEGGSYGTPSKSTGGNSELEEAAGAQSSDPIPNFNGCTNDDYVDRRGSSASRTIDVGGMGLVFTPKCLTVAAGQTVSWVGSFSAHPLAPGNPAQPNAGSAGNPIVETSSGSRVDFTFTRPGTYPYHCELHSFGDGMGMAGVVHVAP